MPLKLDEDESLGSYFEKYEKYINNLEVQLEGKEKKELTKQEVLDKLSQVFKSYTVANKERIVSLNDNAEKGKKSSILDETIQLTEQETRTGKINEERNKIVQRQKEKTQEIEGNNISIE